MKSTDYDVRVAALWLLHGESWVKLLRAHGRRRHAENFEAALGEVEEILANHLGRDTMSNALDWASDQLWLGAESCAPMSKSSLH
ncbi:MAG TPA: hypothetical protein VKY65_16040 [Alphaproteobacteria bacterium]|nr:hypothetical protein [Alphaproteobacteria bacterium]